MAWYWWVLIAIAVAVTGYFKLKLFAKMTGRKKDNDASEDM